MYLGRLTLFILYVVRFMESWIYFFQTYVKLYPYTCYLGTMYKFPFIFILFFLPELLFAGEPKPAAKFSFNGGKNYDEVSGKKAKLVNTVPVKDRFGNEGNAVYISGSRYSYINLGTYKALKPKAGTISLWVKIENEIWSGKGAFYNPILLTKYTQLNDYYEAYAIYYFMESGKINCVTAKDSTCQNNLATRDIVYKNRWYHVAISYNDTSMALYLNGQLESRVPQKFGIRFLEGDSVMVGHTANEKNQRYLLGAVDDIEFFDHVLTDKEVLELYLAPNPNKTVILLGRILMVLAVIIGLILIYFYTRHKVKAAVKIEKEKSEQANKALENELRVHRALMNPHFIFNSLNGLQDFILKNENEEANDYLIKFSQLLRKIMESNMSDLIALELEIELLKRYVEIEGMRFEENIHFTLTVDPGIVPSVTIIPIMMLQPFVENAIWHGLLNKKGDKSIRMSFELYKEKYLKCIIEDNGIGRKKDKFSIEKTSLATVFIKQRLDLLNKIHELECSLVIEDKPESAGTIVTIVLPILTK